MKFVTNRRTMIVLAESRMLLLLMEGFDAEDDCAHNITFPNLNIET